MRNRRRAGAPLPPIPVKAIMIDLAAYLHKQPPGDTDVLLQAMAAGIIAANESGDEAGPALAMLIAALGDAWAGVMARFADQLDLVAADTAGNA